MYTIPYIAAVNPDNRCPNCKTSLFGGHIPYEYREHYSPPYEWNRQIGFYDIEADRTISYECPDCGHTWEAK
jgi:hypothetical protein